MSEAVELFTAVVTAAIPYGMVFALGQKIVDLFMNMAFNGKVKFN